MNNQKLLIYDFDILYQILDEIKIEINFKIINIKKDLISLGVNKIDYIELYNTKTLKKPKNKREKFKIFIAFYLNKTRLIDNI